MSGQNNMHNLTTLIKRLEAATSRLEDIASTVEHTPGNINGAASSTDGSKSAASAAIITPIPEAPEEPLPPAIEDFDELIDSDVQSFAESAKAIGGLVDEQAQAVLGAFQAERTFLLMTTKAKKPEPMNADIIGEIHKYISLVDEIKETNRPSNLFFHLSMVSEGIVGLGWIMEGRPGDFVESALGGAQYNGNKVLKEYREKDQTHVKYVQGYYKLFKSLAAYTRKHYKTGLTWNQKDGIDAMEALQQIQSGAATPKARQPSAASSAPPPPPPPPPAGYLDNGPSAPSAPSSGTAKGSDISAVFDQLNQGSAVTAGLRKVDKSEMTHKNPSLRAAGTVPQRTSSTSSLNSNRSKSPMPAKKPDSLKATPTTSTSKKPPKKELQGTQWIIENQENTGSQVIEITPELNHTILISRCSKCVIKINGKANAISVDNCVGVSLLIGSLISAVDVIKVSKFAIQVDGVLPTILLDQVDGAQIYLQEATMKSPPEVITSKCSAINIVTPPTSDDDDSKETPLPEQLRTYFKNGQLVTEVVEHSG